MATSSFTGKISCSRDDLLPVSTTGTSPHAYARPRAGGHAMNLAELLPLTFVMIAGPQMISAVFLATSVDLKSNSLSYLAGAAVSITTVVTVAFLIAGGAKSAAGSDHEDTAKLVLDWIVLALIVFLLIRVFLTRATSAPPKWMGRLQSAEPRFAFLLGLALLGVFPSDIVTSVSVGLRVGREGDPWWECLVFAVVTITLLALPAIGVLVLGERASRVLPTIRDWMTDQSWIVSEVVLVFFVVMLVNDVATG
jgi:hypothetical protein